MKIAFYPSLSNDSENLEMVGRICATWQQVEFFLEYNIWHWAGLSQKRGRCLTANMPFPLRCEAFRSLAHIRYQNPDYDKALGTLVEKRLRAAKSIRDRFAHALWFADEDKSEFLIEKPSRLEPDIEAINPSFKEMISALLKIMAVWVDLLELIARFEGKTFSPHSWQQKSQQPADLYDQLIAARSNHRAMQRRLLRQPKSSRPKLKRRPVAS